MTYSSGGLIQAADYNDIVSSNAVSLNKVWNDGTGNSGYGQPALPTVSVGNTVLASSWANVVNTEKTIGNHQGTVLTSMTAPVSGDTVTYDSALGTNLSLLSTNRLNAVAQGGTAFVTQNSTSTWNESVTFTMTSTFANNNAARYFFNSGGQLAINASHPAGTGSSINQLISDLCSDAGTVWVSSPVSGTVSLASSSFNGVTKVGGANPTGATITTNAGFYAWASNTTVQLFQQTSDFVYHSYQTGTIYNITAYNYGNGTLQFTVKIDEVPDGATVSANTAVTLTVRSPSTTYLTNTWGTPLLTSSVSTSSVFAVEYLVVGGGGGGGYAGGSGGGGAGGFLTGSYNVPFSTLIPVTVGAGGAPGASGGSGANDGVNGNNSVFSLLTAAGGGGGGGAFRAGKDGASGGGGSALGSNTNQPGGAGTSGFAGGASAITYAGGGGGGAGVVGGTSSSTTGGNGGNGLSSSITGTATYYAGGGGGGVWYGYGSLTLAGSSGLGGGGRGSSGLVTGGNGTAGTAATGGGGGGGGGGFTWPEGYQGGSGVVIIRYPDSNPAATATTGSPTITVAGGYRIYRWTTSGSVTF